MSGKWNQSIQWEEKKKKSFDRTWFTLIIDEDCIN